MYKKVRIRIHDFICFVMQKTRKNSIRKPRNDFDQKCPWTRLFVDVFPSLLSFHHFSVTDPNNKFYFQAEFG